MAERQIGEEETEDSTDAVENGLEELRGFNGDKLNEKLSLSDEEFDKWLMNAKLLSSSRFCDCGSEMSVYVSRRMEKQWKCNRVVCRRTKGLYKNTFFRYSRTPPKELFKLSYYWCLGRLSARRARDQLRKELENDCAYVPTHPTMVSFNAFLRGVCAGYFRMNPLRIGGDGIEVRVERLRITQEPIELGGKQHWGYCGEQFGNERLCFIDEVEHDDLQSTSNMNLSSFLMIVDRYVRPGSEIISSLWKIYEVDGKLPDEVECFAKERSLRLVKSEGEVSNRVAVLWNQFKAEHYKSLDKSELICTHIKEFMWRQLFGGEDCMYHLWSHIASMYPLT